MNTFLLIFGTLIYVPLFYVMCARRPNLALMLIFAVAPFQNEVSGGLPVKFSLAEVNLLLTLPLLLLRGSRLRLGATFWPFLLYMAVSLVCTLPQWRSTSLVSIIQTGVYLFGAVVVFANLARRPEDYAAALKGLVAVGLGLTVAMLIHGSAYVFGLNKNGLGSSLAACFVVAFELFGRSRGRDRWYYAGALALLGVGLFFTLSRGAWLGALTGIFGIFIMRRQFGLLLRSALVLGPLIAVVWVFLPEKSKDYATSFDQGSYNIKLRYESKDLALRYFRSSPIIGVGVGLRKEYDATNLTLLTLAETGVAGVAALWLLFLTVFVMIWRAQRKLPRQSLEFSLLAIAAALTLGKLVHGQVDHYWSRGSLMAAWGSVGMATYVAALQRRRRWMARRQRPTFPPAWSPAPELAAPETMKPELAVPEPLAR